MYITSIGCKSRAVYVNRRSEENTPEEEAVGIYEKGIRIYMYILVRAISTFCEKNEGELSMIGKVCHEMLRF